MKLEIENGSFVGTAEWRGPGQVVLDIADPKERAFFEEYFQAEDAYLDGSVECAHMTAARRDASQEAFGHACFELAAYAYRVKASA